MSKDAPQGDEKKPGKLKKMLLIGLGGVLLLGGGTGAGLYFGGFFSPDPKAKAEDPHRPKLVKRSAEPAAAAEADGGEGKAEPRVGTVYVKSDRTKVDPKKYEAAYLALPENFTSNLVGGDGFVQVGLSVSTYYDDRVFQNVKRHMVPIRSAVLMVLSTQDGAIIASPEGKRRLQRLLQEAINAVLREKEGFGGIDNVYFSNLVVQ